MSNLKRQSVPTMNVLRNQVHTSSEILSYLVQTSPEEIPGSIDGLLLHVSKVKKAKQDFTTNSQQLSSLLIKNGSINNANEVRTERHNLLHEVSEFLNLVNVTLKAKEIDEVSNIDIYTVASNMSNVSEIDEAIEQLDKTSIYEETEDKENHVIFLESDKQQIDTVLAPVEPIRSQNAPGYVPVSSKNLYNPTYLNGPPNTVNTQSSQGCIMKPSNPNNLLYNNYNPDSSNMPARNFQPNLSAHVNNTASYTVLPDHSVQSMHDQPNLKFRDKFTNNSLQSRVPDAFANNHSGFHNQSVAADCIKNANMSNVQFSDHNINKFSYNQNVNQQQRGSYDMNPVNTVPQDACPFIYGGSSLNQQQAPQNNNRNVATNDMIFNYLATQDMVKNSIPMFDGTAYMFWSWIDQIESRIQNLNLQPADILHILQSNSKGAPNKMIANYLASSGRVNEAVLEEVWSGLVERFGSRGKVADEISFELHNVKPITGKNIGKQLLEFYDLCKIASFHVPKSLELQTLNCASGLQNLRLKLPKFLQDQWRRFGQQYEDDNNVSHPPFHVFVNFLKSKSRELNNRNYMDDSSYDYKHNKVMTTRREETPRNESNSENCPIHKSSSHTLVTCTNFLRLPRSEKMKKLAEYHRCFKCLGNHFRNDCQVEVKCEECGESHHTALHIFRNLSNNSSNNNVSNSNFEPIGPANHSLCTKICGSRSTNNLNCSKTMLVYLSSEKNKSVMLKCYCIVDEHSNCTLVDPKVPELLGLNSESHNYTVSTVGGCETVYSGRSVGGLIVRGVDKDEWIRLPDVCTNDFIPNTANEVASKDIVSAHHGIKQYAHNFSDIDSEAEVLILIGRDCGRAMGTVCYGSEEPWVHNTPLGWALVGNACTTVKSTKSGEKRVLKTVITHEHLEVKNTFLNGNKQNDFSVFKEHIDDEEPGFSNYNRKFLDIMSNEVIISTSGNIQAPVPLVSDKVLPSNQAAVYHRSKNTLNRLKTKPANLNECILSINKSLQAGHIEQVPSVDLTGPEGRSWWLPIFPVHHPKKEKLRLVYDASAKYHNTSLNQNLLSGPDLNQELRGVLHRFREEKIAIICDVESMFNNFSVPPRDRDLLRFFWFEDNNPEMDIVQYRAKSHIFGCTSSPSVASYCMRFATMLPDAFPYEMGRAFIQNNFYVDDGISSVGTVPDAITTINEARCILGQYNIRLHKILSNSCEVLAAFPESERAKGCHSLEYEEIPSHRTLGVYWDPVEDAFKIEVSIPDKPFTKRGILAVINSLFDPLGMIAPISLTGRLIQRMVLPVKEKMTDELAKCGWDDILPNKYLEIWENWKKTLEELVVINLSRCSIPKHFIHPERQLHIFCDASEDAIGFVIYLKALQGSEINVEFVTGGAKVAPKTATTMPRLELNAAVEAVQQTVRVISALSFKPVSTTYYSDSMIVLGYIRNNEKSFSKYVTRRVNIIHNNSLLKDWKYVRTEENPSDIATRPCRPSELAHSKWLTGPDFLWTSTDVCSIPELPEELPEQVKELKVLSSNIAEPSIIHVLAARVGSWLKIINVIKIVMSFLHKIDIIRQKKGIHLAPRPSEVEKSHAINQLLILAQKDSFKPQIDLIRRGKNIPDHDKLSELSPFVDRQSLLRVGGRLSNSDVPYDVKYPVLVCSDHPLADRLVQYFHNKVGHQGRHLTHGEVRRHGYHILSGKTYISMLISNCVLCKKLRGFTQTQRMADLPHDRIEEIPVFSNTGLDVFGPFYIFGKKATRSNTGTCKLWVLILVCLASRAIHLEILPSMDTSSFRNALQRFICVRGTPKLIRSDNGTNIVASKTQIEQSVNVSEVQGQLQKQDIIWLFNPPHASHCGGVYERKIGSVRRAMEGCIALMGPRKLSYDEFSTVLQEAGCIVNNTPLCEVSDHPDDPMPITPAALLTLKDALNPSSLEQFDKSDLLSFGMKRWRRSQYLAQEFWVRWRRDYFAHLSKRHKWKTRQPCIGVGDVVLIRDKSAKRNLWPIGRVYEVKRGSDSLVREVVLTLPPLKGSCNTRRFTRSIHDLVLLVASENHNVDCFGSASI